MSVAADDSGATRENARAPRADGPVVLLTGANRGTGRAVAEELHDGGWRVHALSRTPARLPWLHEVACDLRYPEQVGPAVDRVAAAAGGLDAVVTGGVVRALGDVASLPLDDWREAVEVNLTSVLALVQSACRTCAAAGAGSS